MALFSDDEFYDHLVLKGGNALRLVYNLQTRTSLDVDISLDTEFQNLEDTRSRLKHVLRDRLDSAGYVSFDEKLEERPPHARGRWGGYWLTFKVISKADHAQLGGDLEQLRRNALPHGPGHQEPRTWKVEFSKYEYCDGKIPYELDSQPIYVYSPEMIVLEKLRALCQQLPSYPHRRAKKPRARDFFDIHTAVTRLSLQLESSDNVNLGRAIFGAKDVPYALLRELRHTRDYHAPDWPSVQASSDRSLRNFDYYFDFAVDLAERLEPLWEE